MLKKILAVAASLLLLIAVVGYFELKKIFPATPEVQTNVSSYKELLDKAMKNARDPKVLATVNGTEINQTDLDMYSIDGKNRSINDLVRYYVIADYAEKIGLELDTWDKDLIKSIENTDDDEGIDEEYCRSVYGISLAEVTEYRKNRAYTIGMNSAFSLMIIEDIESGEFVERHPKLNKAYETFEKQRYTNKNAWDNLEDAYYELIKKDYDIRIY